MIPLAAILRMIARNLGGPYGACVHLSAANKWYFKPTITDRATPWRVGTPAEDGGWVLLSYGDTPTVQLIGASLPPEVVTECENLVSLATELPPAGVTNNLLKQCRAQLLHLLRSSGNTQTRWPKNVIDLPDEYTETYISTALGQVLPRPDAAEPAQVVVAPTPKHRPAPPRKRARVVYYDKATEPNSTREE